MQTNQYNRQIRVYTIIDHSSGIYHCQSLGVLTVKEAGNSKSCVHLSLRNIIKSCDGKVVRLVDDMIDLNGFDMKSQSYIYSHL